jgi:pyridoxamine 5'-phosphate oxidase
MTFPHQDPFTWFHAELKKAVEAKIVDPNAMQLATVSKDGTPSVRTVLFKGLLRDGFTFYTNYDSPKAKDLVATKKAALNFFWAELAQQIRIDGVVEKLSRAESEDYFRSRPRLSQIGAWASAQSETISDFKQLEERVREFEKKFENQEVPCPENWGGFVLFPLRIEFWFGRIGRLHERFVFERDDVKSSQWRQYLKSP